MTDRVAKQSKKPVRRDPEARREQNRIASRNYREKRKQKLALLHDILDPNALRDIGGASDQDANNPVEPQVPEGAVHEAQPQSHLPSSSPDPFSAFNQFGTSGNAFMPGSWGGFTAIDPSGLFLTPSRSPDILPPSADPLDGFLTSPAQGGWSSIEPVAPTSLALVSRTASAAERDTNATALFQRLTNPNTFARDEEEPLRDVLKGIQKLSSSQKQSLIQLLQRDRDDAEETSIPLSRQKAKIIDLHHDVTDFVWKLRHGANPSPSLPPSACMTEVGFFSAFTANCYALGMGGFSSLMEEDGHSIFSLGPEVGFHSSQLAIMRPKFQYITPHLRPTDVQLTVGHHPYIDIIPFKQFRDKVLQATQGDVPDIDEDELCRDLLGGGILFWGTVANNRGMDASVPWDLRSWEPSTWFLAKYHDFVGGWDDEMWSSTRRWHEDRGERCLMRQERHARRVSVEEILPSSDAESTVE